MMLILLVAIDVGRLFFTYIEVNNAAREAAFVAASDLDYPSLLSRAGQEANVQGQGGVGALALGSDPICTTAANPPTVVTCVPVADAAFVSGAGKMVSVSVTRQFTFLTPLIGALFPPTGSLNVGATATAPVVLESTAGAGGGGTPPDPCAVLADFTYSQSAWNKEVDFDATASTPTGSTCPDKIKNYSWTWDDTSPPSGAPDKVLTSPFATSSGLSGKDSKIFHVTLTVTTVGGQTDTFQQDVLTVNK
jgi:TadE-like protein